MKTSLTSAAAREIAHWRHFFRSRDAALSRSQPAQRARARSSPAEAEREFAPTEWAETEWPDTDIESAAR